MDFKWAVKQLKKGMKVKRDFWREDIYLYTKDGGNTVYKHNDLYLPDYKECDEPWNFYIDDYKANDWILEKEKPKFPIVFEGDGGVNFEVHEDGKINMFDKWSIGEWCKNNHPIEGSLDALYQAVEKSKEVRQNG